MVGIRGEAMKELIPQRDPMIMIDVLHDATESEAVTGLTIAEGNLFCSEGFFEEPGLVEHIAQSASAFAGYKAKIADCPIPLGFIGEVKKCIIHFLPSVGDVLHTQIRVLTEALGITLLTAETKVNDEVAVQCRMKIYLALKDER